MMWNYIQLADETQLAYSDLREDGTIFVVAERPIDSGFDTAHCLLPAFTWSNIEGFSPSEMDELDAIVRDNAPFIFELAQRPLLKYA